MKKKITIILLLISMFIVTNLKTIPVSALDGESVIIQMGGPVSSIYSVDMDDLMKRYASSQAYEARYYPFGEGNNAPVFIGTAYYVRDLKKTDLEIAFYEAMRKSGTDLNSLKKFHEYVEKYEATCGLTVEAVGNLVMDAISNAVAVSGNTLGFAELDVPAGVAGSLGIIISGYGLYDEYSSGNANANTVAQTVFTTADLANTIAGLVQATAQKEAFLTSAVVATDTAIAAGSVAAMGAVAWNTAVKYLEYKEEWRDFVDYLNGRRNLTEFFKWLDAELAEKMKETTGWDVQFNNAETKWTQGLWHVDGLETTGILYARFMHNYVPEFSVGDLGDTNGEGWVGQMELNMEADLKPFQDAYPLSPFDVAGSMITVFRPQCTNIYEDNVRIVEDFYWNATVSSKTFPLKAESVDLKQPQIIFTGPLSNCDYEYRQGGQYKNDFRGAYIVEYDGFREEIVYEGHANLTIDQAGIRDNYSVYNAMILPYTQVFMSDADTNHNDIGDMFAYDLVTKRVKSKMVIDLTKPKGIVYEPTEPTTPTVPQTPVPVPVPTPTPTPTPKPNK